MYPRGMGRRGISTKPSATIQENARKVAMDAFIEGKMVEGKRILELERTTLSKPQAKTIAKHLTNQGRTDDALTILLLSMGKDQATRELSPEPTVKVGDIVYTSGGWEQTNVHFYEVIAVSGSSATIRKINKRVDSSDQYSDYVVPVPGSFVGAPMNKRVQKSTYSSYSIKIDSNTAWVWDGKPQRQTGGSYGH